MINFLKNIFYRKSFEYIESTDSKDALITNLKNWHSISSIKESDAGWAFTVYFSNCKFSNTFTHKTKENAEITFNQIAYFCTKDKRYEKEWYRLLKLQNEKSKQENK
jgi:hypothetical protein